MWFWVVVIIAVIGGVLGFLLSDGKDKVGDTLGGCLGGGLLAAGCVWRILLAGLGIFIVIWLFKFLFG
ncbi:MAG: hypothetical protein LUC86_03285 [Prevotellaceae bacterium]|nr:hypothetical protein [Prevotellaceae bacterium]